MKTSVAGNRLVDLTGKRFGKLTVGEELKANRKVQIFGFGSFEIRERAARTGKDPRTGEMIEIQEKRAPSFKAGKALKDSVNV